MITKYSHQLQLRHWEGEKGKKKGKRKKKEKKQIMPPASKPPMLSSGADIVLILIHPAETMNVHTKYRHTDVHMYVTYNL